MCLAIPAQITALKARQIAVVNVGGIEKQVSIALVDNLKVGDYVVVHVGYALTRLNEDEAKKTLALFAEMAALDSKQT